MKLALRLAVEADIPEMHRIRKAVHENILSDENALSHDDYLPFLGSSGETWVGELDEKMAGFGAIDRRNASVWALFVAPQYEAQGVGKALLVKLIDRARSFGLTGLDLTTTTGTRAEQFYIRQGWQLNGHAPNDEVKLRYACDPTQEKGDQMLPAASLVS